MKTLDDIHLALREGTVDAELVVEVEELIHRWLAEKHLGVVEAWPAGIVQAELDAAGIDELHASLVVFVRSHMDHPQAGLAVWAIGKLVRASDEPLFAAALENGLPGGRQPALSGGDRPRQPRCSAWRHHVLLR